MSSKENRFQLEFHESLYFHPGDEVEELIHISLDPNVTMDELGSETILRGGIELHGEYVRSDNNTHQEETLHDADEIRVKRFIDQVSEKDEMTGSFQHYFPIEISIPTDRIQDRDNVRVEMTTFDYQLPANNKLELMAIAEIQGIENGSSPTEEKEVDWERDEDSTFEFEFTPELTEQENDEEIEQEPAREPSEGDDSETVHEDVSLPLNLEERVVSNEFEAENNDEQLIEITETDNDHDESKELGDVNYLADIFRQQEEDTFTKMKICIVQEGDSFENIAERFQVSTLQLIKKNALDDEFEVSEGQLLYIPRK